MAEETDLSRTEPASSRRLQEARRAGDVPRSGELTAWLVLLAALGVLGWQAPRLLLAMQDLIPAAFADPTRPSSPLFLASAQAMLWALLPVLAAVFAAALVAPLLLSGWVYAPAAAHADLGRATPFKAFSRLLSADAWFDAMLALLKLLIAGVVVGWALASGWADLPTEGGPAALSDAAVWVGRGVLALAGALALVAALDAGWRWWRYLQRHAMTWQEVLAEAREAELPAEVRAQLRARQQQAGQGGQAANAGPKAGPLPLSPNGGSPLPLRGTEVPLAGEHPEGRKGATAGPKTIDEVSG